MNRTSHAHVTLLFETLLFAMLLLASTAEALTLSAVYSRKTHGAQALDVPLDRAQPIGGAVTVESRAIGAGHRIVFVFDEPVASHGAPSASDETGALIGAPVATFAANEVVVTLTGVPDNKRIRVTLPQVNGVLDASASFGVQVGDVDNSRSLSLNDTAQLKALAGQVAANANARFDLNASGAITAADIAAAKARPRVNLAATSNNNGITLAVDPDPLRMTFTPDTARTVSQTIPLEGGTMSVTGADGTVYTLNIPNDALLEETTITMTPALSIATPGIEQNAAFGVVLGPEGAQFHNFVTLTIAPPAGVSAPIDRQIPIGWSGANNVVSLALFDPNSAPVKLKLLHFSGYAMLLALKGTSATLEPVRHRLGSGTLARLESLAAERTMQDRQLQLLGVSEIALQLGDLIQQFDLQVVQPRVAAAGLSCANGRLAIETKRSYIRLLERYGVAVGINEMIPLLAVANAACNREEYELCRDNHIITRIFPHFLAFEREAFLYGVTATPWSAEAEDNVAKCLNFELRLDSRMTYVTDNANRAHTTRETVNSVVKMPYIPGLAQFDGRWFSASLTDPDPLVSVSYDADYPDSCVTVSNLQRIGAGMKGFLGFTANDGGPAQRATVKDFVFTPVVVPDGFGSGYTLTTKRKETVGCGPVLSTTQEHDNWVNTGFPSFVDAFVDPSYGLAIRNWSIVGGDILATKDFTTTQTIDGFTATVVTNLILFHKPAP